ncbi:MAG: beta strand repeat-containing protein, partial [Candidatus Kapaibacterium sp.]
TSVSSLSTALGGQIAVSRNATLSGDGTSGSPLGIDLTNPNSWTGAQTFSSVDVNGGTIDGTAIGGTTAALGRFTVLRSSGATDIGDGDDNVTVDVGTGELTLSGIDADAVPTSVMTLNGSNQVRQTSLSDLANELNDQITVTTNATLSGNGTTGSPLGLNLNHPNSWTVAQTFSSTDINGGTIDGTAIGSSVRSSGEFTSLSTNGVTTLGDGNDNVTVNVGTGELTLQGLDPTASPTSIVTLNGSNQARTTSVASLATTLSGSVTVSRNSTLVGDGSSGSPLGLNLANANSWTAQQTFSSAVVNGGSINATPIGGTTRSTAAFTTLNANSTTILGDGNGDNITLNASDATTGGTVGINVTNGTLDIDGLTQNNALTDLLVVDGTGAIRTRAVSSISGGSGWSLTGNSGTTAGTNFLGTTDNISLVFKTNNAERMRITGTGSVGIGTNNPGQKVEVQDGNVLLSNTGTAGELRFAEPSAGGTQYTAFKAGSQGANITYTLPLVQGAAGSVLANNGTGTLSWTNPNQNGSVGSQGFARKTADESITNVGTLQNDDHLVLPLAASTTYVIEGFLYVYSNVNNAELIIGFDVPASSTMKMTYVAYDGANNIKGGGFLSTDGGASGAIDVTSGTATDIAIWFRGIVVTSTTADNVQLQWAQSAAGTGRTTTVEANSFMQATRVE